MAIQIKKKAGSKPATRSTSKTTTGRKQSTGSTQTKRTAARAKSAPAKKTTAKRSTQAKSQTTRRSPKTDMSQADLNKLLKPLAKAAQKRDRLYEQWKEAVGEASELIVDASQAGVPVVLIVSEDYGNISRQHYYKLMDDAKAGKSSNGSGSKSSAKKAVSKPTAKRSTTAKKTPAKRTTAKKSTGGKRRIRAKA